ncbi:hypothetical protein [Fusobacterium sp.]|uniref:hypothetical protein n=1 Tax=Fusobacterium sp. TaxID=68766 RepID=UPI0029023EB6|nr:hypothetical protein [Fusobacterium sp.]MDU1912049.1 hypothetical protein [Fusobacterium sp.]
MIRGTTPSIVFSTDLNTEDIFECHLIIKSKNAELIKKKSSMKFKDNCIICDLTKEDTLLFQQNGDGKERIPKPEAVFFQLYVTLKDGTVCATKIMKSVVNALLEVEE